MNSNTQQVSEDYKFRMSYIISLLKEMFSTSKEIKETDVANKVKEIIENQDSSHIERLEKELNYSIKRGPKVKNVDFNSKNLKTKFQNGKENNKNNKNNDIVLDKDYDKSL